MNGMALVYIGLVSLLIIMMANSIAPPFLVILEAMEALRFYVYMTHQILSSVISRVTQLIYTKRNFEKQYMSLL